MRTDRAGAGDSSRVSRRCRAASVTGSCSDCAVYRWRPAVVAATLILRRFTVTAVCDSVDVVDGAANGCRDGAAGVGGVGDVADGRQSCGLAASQLEQQQDQSQYGDDDARHPHTVLVPAGAGGPVVGPMPVDEGGLSEDPVGEDLDEHQHTPDDERDAQKGGEKPVDQSHEWRLFRVSEPAAAGPGW